MCNYIIIDSFAPTIYTPNKINSWEKLIIGLKRMLRRSLKTSENSETAQTNCGFSCTSSNQNCVPNKTDN